jgi:hypothetical protein
MVFIHVYSTMVFVHVYSTKTFTWQVCRPVGPYV